MSTPDFFRSRLDAMVDPRHPLAVLAGRLDWEQIESRIAPLFARNGQRQAVEGVDLFGPTPTTVGVHPGGRPRLPFRLMLSLLYLKHAYGESDESVCERWGDNYLDAGGKRERLHSCIRLCGGLCPSHHSGQSACMRTDGNRRQHLYTAAEQALQRPVSRIKASPPPRHAAAGISRRRRYRRV